MTGAASCTAGGPAAFPLERLSAFLDGDLSTAELQLVRRHLETCASCAGRAAELRAMAGTARALEAPEPPPTLWPAIEGALARQPSGWLSWRAFGVGALSGGVAVGAVVVALLIVGRGARHDAVAPAVSAAEPPGAAAPEPEPRDPLLAEAEREFTSAAAVYERSIEKLRGLLAREEGHWSSDTRARYVERLGRLDEAIARSREAARKSPSDAVGNEQLFAAYQQKLAFLTETVHRGGGSRQGTP